jgi:hypothetical protein
MLKFLLWMRVVLLRFTATAIFNKWRQSPDSLRLPEPTSVFKWFFKMLAKRSPPARGEDPATPFPEVRSYGPVGRKPQKAFLE